MASHLAEELPEATVRRARIGALLLGEHAHASASAVAGWLGALQAQDYASGAWSLGIRVPGSTADDIDGAFAAGEVLRTWPLRGTIHVIAAEDARWMLALTGPRVLAATETRRRQLGLESAVVDRAVDALVAELAGGRRMTRAQALATIGETGVDVRGQAGYHVLVYGALLGAICLGPNDGATQTFVRLDEWAPGQRDLGATDALTELAWRYVRSHGPVTAAEFAGWSGLTLTAARAGISANVDRLVRGVFRGAETWLSRDAAEAVGSGLPAAGALALPGFDEFILGYKDRTVHVAPEHLPAIVPGGNGVFRPTIALDGVVVATWSRIERARRIDVDVRPFTPLTKGQQALTRRALERYAGFRGSILGAWPLEGA